MVPLKDENPIQITPYVTYTLIAINVAVFIYELLLTPPELNHFFHLFAIVPLELNASFHTVTTDQPVPEILTLITSQFLHAGFLHVGFNMLFLWIFGNNIEECLGHFKFLVFYLVCGILAALTQWVVAMESMIPTVGASGAIAGVMGAYLLKYPHAKIILFPFVTKKLPAFFFLGFWFVYQAFKGVLSLGLPESSSGSAYWAHAGGFIFGAILATLLGLFSE